MSLGVRSFLAFLVGSIGLALAFWGVLESVRLHHLLGMLAIPVGLLACAAAFKLVPHTD